MATDTASLVYDLDFRKQKPFATRTPAGDRSFVRRKPLGAFGAFILIMVVFVGAFSPWLAGDPSTVNLSDTLVGPEQQPLVRHRLQRPRYLHPHRLRLPGHGHGRHRHGHPRHVPLAGRRRDQRLLRRPLRLLRPAASSTSGSASRPSSSSSRSWPCSRRPAVSASSASAAARKSAPIRSTATGSGTPSREPRSSSSRWAWCSPAALPG